jgi:hypothetical protein
MFGSILTREEKESKISHRLVFCFPKLEGFEGEKREEVMYYYKFN